MNNQKARDGLQRRREFLQLGSAALAFPTMIPSRVLGEEAPSKKIALGVIGCGRIAHSYNVPATLDGEGRKVCSIIAAADVDLWRVRNMRRFLATEKLQGRDLVSDARCVQDYRILLDDPAIDGVLICTPDHWHAAMAVEACVKGKDIFVQKPMAMSVGEGRLIVDAVRKYGRIFRGGTQQRTEEQFLRAVECVRDGRLGKVMRVEIGLPEDPPEYDLPLEEPVPPDFNWNLWLGASPLVPYAQLRSHKRGSAEKPDVRSRPAWMTIQQYCMGMISNWGAHHIDIGQYGLGYETTGPVRVEGTTEYPAGRKLWNVHGNCDITYTYPNGAVMKVGKTRDYPCGVKFIGENGDWIFCGRGGGATTTSSDPDVRSRFELGRKKLAASRPELLEGAVKNPIARPLSHHQEWVQSMRTRKVTSLGVEEVQRSTTTCILGYTAMTLGRPLTWDVKAEKFVGDEAANKTLFRDEREGFGVKRLIAEVR